MTIFGKLVLGFCMLIIGVGVFYGVATYVEKDSAREIEASNHVDVSTSTPEALASSTEIMMSTSTSATTTETKSNGKKISFTEFMSKGGSYKCDITQVVATMTTKGVVYMHDALVRAELSNSVAGQSLNTTMIAKDGYMYSWTSLTPNKGYKTKISTAGSGLKNQATTYTWNGGQVGDYNCEAWSADDSFFELPKTVTFTSQ